MSDEMKYVPVVIAQSRYDHSSLNFVNNVRWDAKIKYVSGAVFLFYDLSACPSLEVHIGMLSRSPHPSFFLTSLVKRKGGTQILDILAHKKMKFYSDNHNKI